MAWYLTDRLGSVRDILDNTGTHQAHFDYNAFGQITVANDPNNFGDRYGFTAREWDSELGLQYTRARYYDPQIRRFISQDPLGFGAGDSNFYRYVGNNATNATDPTGELAFTLVVGITVGVVLIGAAFSQAPTRPNEHVRGGPLTGGPDDVAMLDYTTSLLPGISDGRDVIEIATAHNAITGEPLTPLEYGATIVGLALPFVGATIFRKMVGEGAQQGARRVDVVADGAADTRRVPRTSRQIPTIPAGRRKPPQSPSFRKWYEDGGTIEFVPEGVRYTDADGVSVLYRNDLYPDFDQAGAVAARVDIEMVGDHVVDYDRARQALQEAGYSEDRINELFDPTRYTPHHHENQRTMQFVEAEIHTRIRHRGAVSDIANGRPPVE